MSSSWSPVSFYNTTGSAPIVLICEHASCYIPDEFDGLGLDAHVLQSHIAWDIGALHVAQGLADILDAPLVFCGVSRLLYDCNRPPTAQDCIPRVSEDIHILGNNDISESENALRRSLIHDLFHAAVANIIQVHAQRTQQAVAVVTIHSFTPEYLGQQRTVEIGFLHHNDTRLSEACQAVEKKRGVYVIALNQPYDASHGVTYTLCRHGDTNQYPSVMIEIKNTLIDTTLKTDAIASHLAHTLQTAYQQVQGVGV